MTIEKLESNLKNNQLDAIYLLYGEELYLLENSLKKIKSTFGELVKGINYIEIDETNLLGLIQDIETPAFGYEKKLIIVRNTGIFKREIKKRGQDIANFREKLIEYIKKNITIIEESVVLIFIEESVDKTKLLTTLEEVNSNICNFEYQKLPNLIARLKSICKAYEVEADDTILKYLVECVGVNMQDLINEIRKQIEYAGKGGKITKQSIDILCIKHVDSVIFDLTDNLGKKNITEAKDVLNNLLYAKEPIQKILITLYNHFKKLYIAKLAIKQNRDLATTIGLKPNQMFLVNKYKAQSNYFTQEELKQILEELIRTRYKLQIWKDRFKHWFRCNIMHILFFVNNIVLIYLYTVFIVQLNTM